MSERLRACAALAWFVGACVVAAFLPPARVEPAPRYGAEPAFPGWPSSWEGRALAARPLTWHERNFDRVIPGRTARFRLAGEGEGEGDAGEILFRWVWAPSRKIHSVRWCYRNEGYAIDELPAWIDRDQRTWTRFAARDARGRSFEVREIVLGPHASESWPDPGSWYWNAALQGTAAGPWWAIAWTVPADVVSRSS